MILGIPNFPKPNSMLFNYLKVALRAMTRKKAFAAINIIGLSVGATASLLLFLYVQHELSYDEFFPEHERLYRVVEDRLYPDRTAQFAVIPGGFSTVFPDEIPEIEQSTRLIGFPTFAVPARYGEKRFSEYYFFSADSNFFDVMPFALVKGNKSDVLRHPNTIVLTQSAATRYFGDDEPIGKIIQVNGLNGINDINIEVVGIMQDLPGNSHLKFDALLPSYDLSFLRDPSFYIATSFTYVKLAPGADPATVESKIPSLVEKYAASQIEREVGIAYNKYIANGNGFKYFLQPLSEIHLYSQRLNEIKPTGNITAVRILSFIGVLIVVIAGINFVNLATARSSERAREVGVRKVLGSRKRQLVFQFLSESMLLSVASMVLAIVGLELILGTFNTLAQTTLSFNLTANPMAAAVVVVVTLMLGFVAGIYPAFFISNLKPVVVLKGKFRSSGKGKFLRNGLVVFQFSVAITLISATLIVYDQLYFLENKSLGFEKEDVLVVPYTSDAAKTMVLQEEIQRISGVEHVGFASSVPGTYFFNRSFRIQGSEEILSPKSMQADDEYVTTMNLKVVEGRAFNKDFNDSLNVLINKKAVASLNIKDPIGAKLINIDSNTPGAPPVPYTIIGVVEDFNFESLHTTIAPLVIMSTEGQFDHSEMLTVKLDRNVAQKAIGEIEEKWKQLVPDEAFTYNFMDSRLSNLYVSENQSGKLLMVFTGVAIVIACVGLFGLSAYTANQRTKEIGIRKVLGASVASIVGLLSKDFFKLVGVALLVGTSASWILAGEWLQSFAYRVPLSILTFATASLIVIAFTIVTIGYQAISASIANPVDSLKEE